MSLTSKDIQLFMQAVDKLTRVKAIEADMEGCKAENQERLNRGESLAYGEDHFFRMSHQIQEIFREGWC